MFKIWLNEFSSTLENLADFLMSLMLLAGVRLLVSRFIFTTHRHHLRLKTCANGTQEQNQSAINVFICCGMTSLWVQVIRRPSLLWKIA
ncbi:hypothetical protein BDR06DRAFT_961946 [Suillus hirtellus]|nr:hypothetical protein BDR06DRAFT_961946 [Suillus hirtellus]